MLEVVADGPRLYLQGASREVNVIALLQGSLATFVLASFRVSVVCHDCVTGEAEVEQETATELSIIAV